MPWASNRQMASEPFSIRARKRVSRASRLSAARRAARSSSSCARGFGPATLRHVAHHPPQADDAVLVAHDPDGQRGRERVAVAGTHAQFPVLPAVGGGGRVVTFPQQVEQPVPERAPVLFQNKGDQQAADHKAARGAQQSDGGLVRLADNAVGVRDQIASGAKANKSA
jgi:hypothetical protein